MSRFLKDILDQPDELLHSMEYSLSAGSASLQQAADLIRQAKSVFIVAIGASWNAGIAIQVALNEAGVQAVLCDAADFLYFTKIPPEAVVLFLSRSGESVEIVNALPKCKQAYAVVISITNAAESALANDSTVCLLTHVRFDHSVSVSTYSSIILTGLLLAQFIRPPFSGMPVHDIFIESIEEVRKRLPEWIDMISTTAWMEKDRTTYFTARGIHLASAHESMLLWEEVAKQPASALTTGAFRHGPQEIINHPLNMAIWIDNEVARHHDFALINDLVERQVKVLSIGYNLPKELKGYKLDIPSLPCLLGPVVNIIPMQLASAKLASMKGIDPDVFLFCNFIVQQEGGL
jgi:glucosamine--fructose-6-phosphate aminotransferase (isomerizing)